MNLYTPEGNHAMTKPSTPIQVPRPVNRPGAPARPSAEGVGTGTAQAPNPRRQEGLKRAHKPATGGGTR